jgi:hypothetical protein
MRRKTSLKMERTAQRFDEKPSENWGNFDKKFSEK